ncbi:MAG: trimethylamine methyltransferase family protein [Oligoflexia bacterium]|nr:trimethylamine methyltransferase family protein [Oligoflexia bacterium]
MNMNTTSTNSNLLRMSYFSKEQVNKIHSNALDILQTHGFQVEHDAACEILQQHGAEVDYKTKMVKVSPELVDKCIKAAAKEFVMGARNSARDITLKSNPALPITRNGGGVDKIIDIESGKLRNMNQADTEKLFRALDAIDCINMVAPLYPNDIPEKYRDVSVLETLFLNTSKHVNIRTFSKKNLDLLVEMGLAMAGGKENFRKRPLFSLFDSPISPLKFPELTVDVFLTAGKFGIPLFIATLPIAGATGPYPMAGMVQLLHAELLAGTVICQCANPGAPIILHPLAMNMDFHTMLALSGSIESTMITAAAIQVANETTNLPLDVHGPWSDTYIADSQSMLERTFQALFPALSGTAIIAGFGDVQEGLAFCPIQLSIDEELIAYTMKALKGIPFDDDRLAKEAIKRVSINGDYMTEKSTVKYLRSDYINSKIMNRLTRDEWERQGSRDINSRAKERIQKLMNTPTALELDSKLKAELRSIVKRAQEQ